MRDEDGRRWSVYARWALRVTVLGALLLAGGQAARAQGALAQIRARGELVITTDATYPPFEFKQNGQLQGFDIDLGNEIGKELGVRVRWMPLEWAAVFGAVETGKVDLIMSGVTITDERKKGNGFSRPYFLSGQTIARRKGDNRIRTIQDLKDKTVSVQEGTTGQFAVEKIGVPSDHILKFDLLQDGLMDVRNGRSDATVADLPALKANLTSYPELELTGGIIKQEYVGIVARRGANDLVAALNQALDRIFKDGRYAQLYQKWIGEPLTPDALAELDRVRNLGSLGSGPTPAAEAPASALSIDWGLLRKSLPLLLAGARMTLEITALTLLIGVPLGLLVALMRLARFRPLSLAAMVYVEVVRGTPLLMQIYVIYFVLPTLHLNFSNFVAAVAALSLNAAAYISEIFRAGIQSIDSGQMEAARSLGMDYRSAMRWVILPQAMRLVLPPLTNEAVALLKDSSLVSVVALSELMRVGKELATDTGKATTVYLAVALIYLIMTLPLTYLVRRLEAKWQPISRPRARKSRMLWRSYEHA